MTRFPKKLLKKKEAGKFWGNGLLKGVPKKTHIKNTCTLIPVQKNLTKIE